MVILPPTLHNDILHLSDQDKRTLLEALRIVEGKTGKKVQSLSELVGLAAEILQVPIIKVIGLSPQQLLEELRSSEQPAVQLGSTPEIATSGSEPSVQPQAQPSDEVEAIEKNLLRDYTNSARDDCLRQVAILLTRDDLTANQKLEEWDKLIPIPPTFSCYKLAEYLRASHTTIRNTTWWGRKRRGAHLEEQAERERRLRARGRDWPS